MLIHVRSDAIDFNERYFRKTHRRPTRTPAAERALQN